MRNGIAWLTLIGALFFAAICVATAVLNVRTAFEENCVRREVAVGDVPTLKAKECYKIEVIWKTDSEFCEDDEEGDN